MEVLSIAGGRGIRNLIRLSCCIETSTREDKAKQIKNELILNQEQWLPREIARSNVLFNEDFPKNFLPQNHCFSVQKILIVLK
jgi:hypothetical protein